MGMESPRTAERLMTPAAVLIAVGGFNEPIILVGFCLSGDPPSGTPAFRTSASSRFPQLTATVGRGRKTPSPTKTLWEGECHQMLPSDGSQAPIRLSNWSPALRSSCSQFSDSRSQSVVSCRPRDHRVRRRFVAVWRSGAVAAERPARGSWPPKPGSRDFHRMVDPLLAGLAGLVLGILALPGSIDGLVLAAIALALYVISSNASIRMHFGTTDRCRSGSGSVAHAFAWPRHGIAWGDIHHRVAADVAGETCR